MRHPRLVLLLAVLAAFAVGVLVGWRARISTEEVIVHPDKMLPAIPGELAYEPPLPSPSPIVGLHEYAAPLRVAPTASPTPTKVARPTTAPTATHTGAGSGRRTTFRVRLRTSHNLRGVATWHATGRDGAYAAAGPELRRAIGPGWRGTQVLVCHGSPSRCLVVTLNDWCLCSRGDRLVDLSDEAFRFLAPLSRGIIKVAVGW